MAFSSAFGRFIHALRCRRSVMWTYPPLLLVGVVAISSAQSPDSLTFEVASLKPSSPGAVSGVVRPAPGGGRYVAEHAPLRTLIITAYRVVGRN
jgi:hypothetical protein